MEEPTGTGSSIVFSILFIFAAGTGTAWIKMNGSLKREPMELLSVRQEV